MPKQLNSRCRELVACLIDYFEQERINGGPFLPLNAVRERVAAALKLSLSTVSTISQAVKNNEVLKSPPKKRYHKKTKTNTEELNVSGIRDVIYDMYKTKKHVTLESLKDNLVKKQMFDGSTTSLWRVLKQLGFRWQKDSPRRGLMELPNIAVKRTLFLRNYIEEKEACLYKFVFIDETWIFQNGTICRSWQNEDKRSVRTIKTDGKRYIIINAGSEDGFINGAQAIYSSNNKISDYHGEMNKDNFLHWFEEQLLKNLEQPSIIIMDNAPYHSMLLHKMPNSSSTKAQIQEWLTKKNINFSVKMFKCELLEIVKQNKPPHVYIIDHLAEQYGHKVLRLPPYHCIFNPIELIWGISKQYYNRHIGRDGNTEQDCLNMWSEALEKITSQTWKNAIQHCEKEIKKWYERERILDRLEVDPIIINTDNQDSDDIDDSD
ncbi:unnamed protein product [Diabrotica balteata]|uniref:Tc1-like transposase DDE domain-containing protein n=1 Tax=Diabrotica balteata TaxID=107213 RepID=A0A9N9SYH1_DIABA|nr:unnamed protein product [Diabrotica balteata]